MPRLVGLGSVGVLLSAVIPKSQGVVRADYTSIYEISQPGWRQLQEISIVPFASLQYWLQYLLSFGAGQLQDG
jgi:hypothetical protein